MTLFHVAEAKAFAEEVCIGAMKFVVPSNATTPNTQILPVQLPVGNPGTSQLTATWTITPYDSRVPIFCTPNGSVAGNPANVVTMPKGMPAGAQTAGSEFMVDLSGFPALIISCNASYIAGARGAATTECGISALDPINKLLFIQCYNTTSGAAVAATPGATIAVQFEFCDGFGV